MITTVELKAQTRMPVCRYEIVAGGPHGAPIRYAKIGDSVYHKWTCVSELDEVYCMRVHTCTVYDGQGGERVEVLDARGCSVDKFVLLDLDYVTDLSAGQEAHVFKFADRPALYFNCQVELTLKDRVVGCSKAVLCCCLRRQLVLQNLECMI
uniref:ZP domain-containing protein n=1 Tax=Parascaris univalens TaxID=6257 RepID=A0A915ATP1_PARUN